MKILIVIAVCFILSDYDLDAQLMPKKPSFHFYKIKEKKDATMCAIIGGKEVDADARSKTLIPTTGAFGKRFTYLGVGYACSRLTPKYPQKPKQDTIKVSRARR